MEDTPGRVELNVLLVEYRASLRQSNHLATRMTIASLGGFLFLGLLTALLFYFRSNIPIALAWVAPLGYLIVFGVLIGLASQQVAAAWQGRILALRLERLGGETPLPDTAQDPFNLWRLSWKLRLLAGAPAAVFGGLFLLTGYFCARSVYNHGHIQGTGFIFFYVLLALVELAALHSLYADLPRLYRTAYQAAASTPPVPIPALRLEPPLRSIQRWLLPAPGGLLDHGRAFWAGFLVPLLLLGLSKAQLPVLNALFSGLTGWKSPADVPALAIVGLGVLIFLALELLLQQAVNLLAGLRQGDDPAGRAPYPLLQIVLRWLAALWLAYLLGWRGLLVLFLVISAYEIIRLLLVRPNSERHPVIGLLWDSAGLPLRFAAGVLVWGGPAWHYAAYLAMGVFVYFLALGLGAAARRRQARARYARAQPASGGDAYFLQRGAYWRQVGLWSALLSGGLLFAVQLLLENCAIRPGDLPSSVYGVCQAGGNPVLAYTLLDKVNALLVAFDLLVIVLLVSMLLVWLVGWRRPRPRAAAADGAADPALPASGADAAGEQAQPENPDAKPAPPPDVPVPSPARRTPAAIGWLSARFAPIFYTLALLVVLIGFLQSSPAWAIGGVELAVLGAIMAKDKEDPRITPI